MEKQMVEGAKKVTKRFGRMTRRTAIRRMWLRGTRNESTCKRMAMSYVARRIGYDVETTYRYLTALNTLGMVRSYFDKRSVVFVRAVA